MANNIIDKKQNILHNSIDNQRLTHPNQLTIHAWNNIINMLRVQANSNAEYIEKLHKWFIGQGEDIVNIPSSESFADYVLGSIRSITTDPSYVHLFYINDDGDLVVRVKHQSEDKRYYINDEGVLCIEMKEGS